jgi:radical SAM superfamily enzyme YgiQ (UPF0313 family)
MKIAFVNSPFLPRYSRPQRSPGVTKGGTLYYPYWLAYACGWAQKNGFTVALFDFVASRDNSASALAKIKTFSPDLVVIETSTPSIYADVKFARRVKSTTKAFLLLVGTHVSALPKETLRFANRRTQSLIDAVAVGEYDQTVIDLAQVLEKKRSLSLVSGLVYWQNKQLISNPARVMLNNLDDFPFVSQIYHQFLNPKDYYFAAAGYPMMMVVSGRGCPYGCSYCLWPQTLHGLKYRCRSADNLAAEFDFISSQMPEIKEIIIEDDTFTADIQRVKQFCRLLIKDCNRLAWSADVRVHLDLVTMKLMKQAGCRLLIVGYESGSPVVLKNMGKKIIVADSLVFARRARQAGLLVHGCFMVGNPGETRQTMAMTLSLAKKLSPDSAQFYPLFAYPGTRAYNWASTKGYLKTTDFRRWLNPNGTHRCVVDLPNLSAREMTDFCNRAYFRFYFRPQYLVNKIIQLIRQPQEGKRSLRAAWYFILNLWR